jgi:hypothetical protein
MAEVREYTVVRRTVAEHWPSHAGHHVVLRQQISAEHTLIEFEVILAPDGTVDCTGDETVKGDYKAPVHTELDYSEVFCDDCCKPLHDEGDF